MTIPSRLTCSGILKSHLLVRCKKRHQSTTPASAPDGSKLNVIGTGMAMAASGSHCRERPDQRTNEAVDERARQVHRRTPPQRSRGRDSRAVPSACRLNISKAGALPMWVDRYHPRDRIAWPVPSSGSPAQAEAAHLAFNAAGWSRARSARTRPRPRSADLRRDSGAGLARASRALVVAAVARVGRPDASIRRDSQGEPRRYIAMDQERSGAQGLHNRSGERDGGAMKMSAAKLRDNDRANLAACCSSLKAK